MQRGELQLDVSGSEGHERSAEREAELQQVTREEAGEPFDLSAGR